MTASSEPAVWFPAVRAGTGTDVFTERLCAGLNARSIRAEITWLPLRAEYAPWTVPVPKPPDWANVAHVNTWLHPRFLPRQLPIVATLHHSVHDPALRRYKGSLRAAYHRWWIAPVERRVMRRASRVVAVSGFVAAVAKRTLCSVPIEVIYNGVDTDVYRLRDPSRSPRQPFRLLYVGSWTRRKGVDLLAPIMCGLGPAFELSYTGGPAATRDRLRTPTNMRDLGRLDGDVAVAAAMQDADALLFPSRSEGLPLVAIEAMACGLPIIATRGSSLPEVVNDRVTGFLCPCDDIKAFVNATRRLAGDPVCRRSMTSAARQRAVGDFSTLTMLDAYVRLYEQLAAAPATRGHGRTAVRADSGVTG